MLKCLNVVTIYRKIPKAMEQQVTQNTTEEKKELAPNQVMAPGKIRVIKRNGKVVSFEDNLFFLVIL